MVGGSPSGPPPATQASGEARPGAGASEDAAPAPPCEERVRAGPSLAVLVAAAVAATRRRAPVEPALGAQTAHPTKEAVQNPVTTP